jgi:soluble lytic murein transglycosylase-like protein
MTDPVQLASRLPPRLARWAPIIAFAADTYGIDPIIFAAIIDRESLGGDALAPPGPAGTGDSGHGRGLGQIDDRMHASFIAALDPASTPLWKLPHFNLLYAAAVLGQAWTMFGPDPLSWPIAIAAYNAGPGHTKQTELAFTADMSQNQRIAALDAITDGGDYVSDVLRRRDGFLTANSNGGVA